MAHAAPPPTQAEIEKVSEWNERLCSMLQSMPPEINKGEWAHGEARDDSMPAPWEEYPVWGFSCPHDTIPGRELSILWGLPQHADNCTCIEPAKPKLLMAVLDTDTGEPVSGAAEVRIVDPANCDTILAIVGIAVGMFGLSGTL